MAEVCASALQEDQDKKADAANGAGQSNQLTNWYTRKTNCKLIKCKEKKPPPHNSQVQARGPMEMFKDTLRA
jgi:hypothetical protein